MSSHPSVVLQVLSIVELVGMFADNMDPRDRASIASTSKAMHAIWRPCVWRRTTLQMLIQPVLCHSARRASAEKRERFDLLSRVDEAYAAYDTDCHVCAVAADIQELHLCPFDPEHSVRRSWARAKVAREALAEAYVTVVQSLASHASSLTRLTVIHIEDLSHPDGLTALRTLLQLASIRHAYINLRTSAMWNVLHYLFFPSLSVHARVLRLVLPIDGGGDIPTIVSMLTTLVQTSAQLEEVVFEQPLYITPPFRDDGNLVMPADRLSSLSKLRSQSPWISETPDRPFPATIHAASLNRPPPSSLWPQLTKAAFGVGHESPLTSELALTVSTNVRELHVWWDWHCDIGQHGPSLPELRTLTQQISRFAPRLRVLQLDLAPLCPLFSDSGGDARVVEDGLNARREARQRPLAAILVSLEQPELEHLSVTYPVLQAEAITWIAVHLPLIKTLHLWTGDFLSLIPSEVPVHEIRDALAPAGHLEDLAIEVDWIHAAEVNCQLYPRLHTLYVPGFDMGLLKPVGWYGTHPLDPSMPLKAHPHYPRNYLDALSGQPDQGRGMLSTLGGPLLRRIHIHIGNNNRTCVWVPYRPWPVYDSFERFDLPVSILSISASSRPWRLQPTLWDYYPRNIDIWFGDELREDRSFTDSTPGDVRFYEESRRWTLMRDGDEAWITEMDREIVESKRCADQERQRAQSRDPVRTSLLSPPVHKQM